MGKVTRVINCCGQQVLNHWESIGVTYLTYKWADVGSQVILDEADTVITEAFNFMEEAAEKGEGVLVHCQDGQSRSCVIVTAYLMKKLSWSLRQATLYLKSRQVLNHWESIGVTYLTY